VLTLSGYSLTFYGVLRLNLVRKTITGVSILSLCVSHPVDAYVLRKTITGVFILSLCVSHPVDAYVFFFLFFSFLLSSNKVF